MGASLVFGVQITSIFLVGSPIATRRALVLPSSALAPVLVLLQHHRISVCGVQKGLSIPEPL